MGLKKIRVLPDQYIVREGEKGETAFLVISGGLVCLLYTSPSPRDSDQSRMPSSA